MARVDLPATLLTPAAEAARRALRELEPDEVPAALRKVAGSSARRLPPPYLRQLLQRLDEDEWLRAKAAEAWEQGERPASSPATTASALFLLRPGGWETQLEDLRTATQSQARQAEVHDLQRTVDRLEEELATARARMTEARQQIEQLQADNRRLGRDRRAELERARREGARSIVDHEAIAHERARLERELVEADRRLDFLREELLRARRRDPAQQSTQEPSLWRRRDPAAMAALLDELVTAVRPGFAGDEAPPVGEEQAVVTLPAGLAPDRPEAVDWLLDQPEPFTLLIDGYNVTFAFEPEGFAGSEARRRLNERVARLCRLSTAPVRAIVVYDSDEEGGDPAAPTGVEVRFAPSADEAVVALAEVVPGPVVVVTSDREVRERAEAAGAVGLWSDALAGWPSNRGG